jgi:hypothetical protein
MSAASVRDFCVDAVGFGKKPFHGRLPPAARGDVGDDALGNVHASQTGVSSLLL